MGRSGRPPKPKPITIPPGMTITSDVSLVAQQYLPVLRPRRNSNEMDGNAAGSSTSRCAAWYADNCAWARQAVDIIEELHVELAHKQVKSRKRKKPDCNYRTQRSAKRQTVWKPELSKEEIAARVDEVMEPLFCSVAEQRESFEHPWQVAKCFYDGLILCRNVSVEEEFQAIKQPLTAQIKKIRAKFDSRFDEKMRQWGFCCGKFVSVIERICQCNHRFATKMFVQDGRCDADSIALTIACCESCYLTPGCPINTNGNRPVRQTHRFDWFERRRMECEECKRELHMKCSLVAPGMYQDLCKDCFSWENNAVRLELRTRSEPFCQEIQNNMYASFLKEWELQQKSNPKAKYDQPNEAIKKLLSQVSVRQFTCKERDIEIPIELANSIKQLKEKRRLQKLPEDEFLRAPPKSVPCITRMLGLVNNDKLGEHFLGLIYTEEVGDGPDNWQLNNRALMEVIDLADSVYCKETDQFFRDVFVQFCSAVAQSLRQQFHKVHFRVAANKVLPRGAKAQETTNHLINTLRRQNVMVKTLAEDLKQGPTSLYCVPLFTDPKRGLEIIGTIRECGVPVNNIRAPTTTSFTIDEATRNYFSQLTKEFIVTAKDTTKLVRKWPVEQVLSPVVNCLAEFLQFAQEYTLALKSRQHVYYTSAVIYRFIKSERVPVRKADAVLATEAPEPSPDSGLDSSKNSPNHTNFRLPVLSLAEERHASEDSVTHNSETDLQSPTTSCSNS